MHDYIRQLMALPFLPARHIQQTFDHLKTKANTNQLQRLVDYIDRQWFHHPVFDVPSWCIFQQTVQTNNDVEGKKKFYELRTVFKIIQYFSRNVGLIANLFSKVCIQACYMHIHVTKYIDNIPSYHFVIFISYLYNLRLYRTIIYT